MKVSSTNRSVVETEFHVSARSPILRSPALDSLEAQRRAGMPLLAAFGATTPKTVLPKGIAAEHGINEERRSALGFLNLGER